MHSSIIFLSSILATAVLGVPAPASLQQRSESNSTADNQAIIEQLELAPTAVSRAAILTNPEDYVFDFQNPAGTGAITKGAGGMTVKADRKLFPALIGTGVAMTLGFLGPCGFNTPHTHPRSAEINVCVQGNLVAEFQGENGETPITNNITQFQMTVFPQGAMHTEFNPDCTESIFVAGFASEDPGVQQVAQTFFGLEKDIVQAALAVDTINGQDIEQFKALIPPNVAAGVESCLARCNIKKTYKA